MSSVVRPQTSRERERKLSFRRQSGMAAGKDETEAIILDLVFVEGSFVDAPFVVVRFDGERKIFLGCVEACAGAFDRWA